MNIFVDTNYFVRYIENDNDEMTKIVESLFVQAVAGKVSLKSSVIVFFEIYWLLKSFYGEKGESLKKILIGLLDMSFVDWENKKILRSAVGAMSNLSDDLEDAYNCYYSLERGINKLASFDRKLVKYWDNIKA